MHVTITITTNVKLIHLTHPQALNVVEDVITFTLDTAALREALAIDGPITVHVTPD